MAPVPRLYHRQRQLKIIIRRIRAKDGEARGGRNSADRLKAVGFKGKPVAADWNTARFRTCTHVPVLRVARPTFRSLANDRVAFLKLKPFRPPPFCLSIFVCLSVSRSSINLAFAVFFVIDRRPWRTFPYYARRIVFRVVRFVIKLWIIRFDVLCYVDDWQFIV